LGSGKFAQEIGGVSLPRGGGNCSAGHGAPSSCSEFRAALIFSINSTSPSSPPTSMVGEAGAFVFTGALWLGRGAHLGLACSVATSEQGLRTSAADGRGYDLRRHEPDHAAQAGGAA
jgi:hypothetical protein